jgi:hypothetical protein
MTINLAMVSDKAEGLVDGIIAPIRGLNSQTTLAGLTKEYAAQLDNWVCQPDALITRTGCTQYKTGFGAAAPPKTLMTYSSATATKMFVAAADGIYDVSTYGALGAAVTACTAPFGKFVNFATSAGQYLYFVNGVDTPKLYDGTSWVSVTGVSTPAITGPTTSNFTSVETYRQRLYFLHKDFLGFYYLPADSIGGAATAFRIGSLCRLGGKAVGQGTWSIDGGSGPDDHYAVATSNGEVVVWHGSDPGVVANWTLGGVFSLGKPMGVNCFVKFGGDLLYLSENGVIPMSTILQSTGLNYTSSLTAKIQALIMKQTQLYGNNAGWKIHVNPKRSLVLINVPVSSTISTQFVYNSQSKAWSTFSGWNAADFIEYNGETYFTTGGVIAKAFDGTSDFGNDIKAVCDTSFARFGTRQQLLPLMIRAIYASNASIGYSLGIAQDFSAIYTDTGFGTTSASGGVWDSALWNTAFWGGGFDMHRDWVTIAARGAIALSTRFSVLSKHATTVLLAFDYKFAEQGLLS